MPSWLAIHWNGSNRTCNAICQGRSKNQSKKPILFCQIWEYGTTPTNNVQGQLKRKWACLIKHMADADIPHAKIQMQRSMPNHILIPICLYWISLEITLRKRFQMCKPKSEVVELVEYNTSKQPRTMCNAKYQPKPQAASFLFWWKYQI